MSFRRTFKRKWGPEREEKVKKEMKRLQPKKKGERGCAVKGVVKTN
jgi:hypothetical protein